MMKREVNTQGWVRGFFTYGRLAISFCDSGFWLAKPGGCVRIA